MYVLDSWRIRGSLDVFLRGSVVPLRPGCALGRSMGPRLQGCIFAKSVGPRQPGCILGISVGPRLQGCSFGWVGGPEAIRTNFLGGLVDSRLPWYILCRCGRGNQDAFLRNSVNPRQSGFG